MLQKQASFFFVPLCSQLVNDPSPGCREVVAVTLKTLLGQVRERALAVMSVSVCGWEGVTICVWCICGLVKYWL